MSQVRTLSCRANRTILTPPTLHPEGKLRRERSAVNQLLHAHQPGWFFDTLSAVEKEQQEHELREAMATKRGEYLQLTAEYDKLLEGAHALEHGSPQIMQVLLKANALGKEVAAALREYHDAVEQLTEFYRASAPPTE